MHSVDAMITFLYDQNKKYHVTNVDIVKEKQKYQVTFLCEENESIILQHFTGKAKTAIHSEITSEKRYFTVSVLRISEGALHSCHDYIPL